MTFSKRIFCIILCLMALLSMPLVISAEEETTLVSDDFAYMVLDDGTVCVTSYLGESTDVEVPAQIDGKNVSAIGTEIFWYNKEITSVKLPETIEFIGDRAFQGCTSITEIKLPESVHEIGDACFHECSSLSKINVPANLVYVGAFAFDETPWITQFDGCTSIILGGSVYYKYLADEDMVVIPDKIVCISGNAFDGKSLSFVKIPETVAFIGDYAFYNCKNLKEIKLPSTIYYLGENSVGIMASGSEPKPVKDFVIYSDENTMASDYAETYKMTVKSTAEYTEPASLPEAEVCVPTAEIRDVAAAPQSAGLSQGGVVAIVISIAGCVVIIGGVAVASHFYEKKRKQENKNIKKKKN